MLQSEFIPKEIREHPGWHAAVSRAGEWIHRTLGPWAGTKHFAWAVRPGESAGPQFELRIEADGGAASARFDWAELNDHKRFTERVNRLWGELLDGVLRTEIEDLKRLRVEWQKEAAVGTQE